MQHEGSENGIIEDTEELGKDISSFDDDLDDGGSGYDSDEVVNAIDGVLDTMGGEALDTMDEEVVDAMGEPMRSGYTGGYGLTQRLRELVPLGVSVSKVAVAEVHDEVVDEKLEEMKVGISGLGIDDSGEAI